MFGQLVAEQLRQKGGAGLVAVGGYRWGRECNVKHFSLAVTTFRSEGVPSANAALPKHRPFGKSFLIAAAFSPEFQVGRCPP
jgi:hypothetical protein